MKIYVNNSNENWICDRMRSEFISNNPSLITENILESDVIWLLSHWTWRQTPVDLLSSKKVVATIHHFDLSKKEPSDFFIRDKFIDLYICPNEKTKNDFPVEIDREKIKILPYWYNESLWPSISDKEEQKEKLDIPSEKLVIGSFQRDTEGFDLKSPKLCKGPDIFCNIVENLDTKPHVVLAGWRRQYVISRLENAGISYSYFEMANLRTLAELYNCLDLYLVTSRYEGGPQAIFECASTKTPILSTSVGLSQEVLDAQCICKNREEFVRKINKKDFKYTSENYNNAQKYKMENLFPEYVKFFKSI